MKIDLIKKIDIWFGIPICFLLSIYEKVKRRFFAKNKGKVYPKRIIFLGFSEMGSVILAYFAIKKARELYPEAEFYFWTFEQNFELLGILEIIPAENIIVIRPHNLYLLLLDTLKNLLRIRKIKIDAAIDLELFSRFSSILSYLSGAEFKTGFYRYALEGLYRGDFLSHKVMYSPYIHISKNFVNLAESLSVSPNELPLLKRKESGSKFCLPKISIADAERDKIWNRLKAENTDISENRKIVIINSPFDDKFYIRRWPIASYIALIRKLVEESDIFVVLIGLESKEASAFFRFKNCINLIGKTTIRELIGLFGISNIIISHDSGISHLAALTDINILVLFGPETPCLYAPLSQNAKIFYKNFSCSPCLSAYNHRSSVCKDNKCLQVISVDEVCAAVKMCCGISNVNHPLVDNFEKVG